MLQGIIRIQDYVQDMHKVDLQLSGQLKFSDLHNNIIPSS